MAHKPRDTDKQMLTLQSWHTTLDTAVRVGALFEIVKRFSNLFSRAQSVTEATSLSITAGCVEGSAVVDTRLKYGALALAKCRLYQKAPPYAQLGFRSVGLAAGSLSPGQ